MSFNSLVYNLQNLNEDTSSGNISYLPSGFISMRQTIAGLAGLKSKWKVEVLEKEKDYDVNFEDQLSIIVPKIHYQHFNDNVIKVHNVSEVDLKNILNEAISDEFSKLIKLLTTTLRENPQVSNAVETYNAWVAKFKYSNPQPLSEKVLINLRNYDKEVVKVTKEIEKRYSQNRGYLEMLLGRVQESTPLNSLKYLNEFIFIVCGRVMSKLEEVNLQFEVGVNLSFQPIQVITVLSKDDAILEKMKEIKGVKVVRNQIFPMGGTFSFEIFDTLKKLILGEK